MTITACIKCVTGSVLADMGPLSCICLALGIKFFYFGAIKY